MSRYNKKYDSGIEFGDKSGCLAYVILFVFILLFVIITWGDGFFFNTLGIMALMALVTGVIVEMFNKLNDL